MDLTRRQPRRRAAEAIDFKKLAGVGQQDIQELDDQEFKFSSVKVKNRPDFGEICFVCQEFCGPKTTETSKRLNKSGRSILSALTPLLPSSNTLPSNESFVCSLCLNMIEDLDRLETEVDRAKKKLSKALALGQKLLKENKIIPFTISNVKIDVVRDDFISETEGKDFAVVAIEEHSNPDFMSKSAEIKIKTTDNSEAAPGVMKLSLMPKLTLFKDDLVKIPKDSSEISSSQLAAIGASFKLSNEGRLEIKSQAKAKGLFCQSCRISFNSISAILEHLQSDCDQNIDDTENEDNNKTFKCDECSRSFSRQAAFKQHILLHHSDPYKFTCNECGNQFSSETNLSAHLRSHQGQKPFECKTCDKSFTRKASLLEHMSRHKGIRDKECTICQKKFYSTSYWRHMATVHAQEEKLVYKCQYCDRKFAQRFRLAMHETSHVAYEQREYICDRCPDEKRFATKNRLATHVKQVHEGEKVFGSKLCSDCGMIFNSVSSLHAHRKRQHLAGGKELPCEKCELSFSSSSALQRHTTEIHDGSHNSKIIATDENAVDGTNVGHECSWCGVKFASLDLLDDHAQHCQQNVIPNTDVVGHEEIVQPDYTDFDSNAILQIQAVQDDSSQGATTQFFISAASGSDQAAAEFVINTDSQNEATRQLLMTTDSNGSLVLPMVEEPPSGTPQDDPVGGNLEIMEEQPPVARVVSHVVAPRTRLTGSSDPAHTSGSGSTSGEHPCIKCNKVFATSKAKVQHERNVHSKTKSHACGTCGKLFANAHYLKDHLRTHSELKPHKCKVCDKAFRLAKDLTRHSRVHTGEKPFKCQDCGKCFSASSNLSEHRTLHTGRLPYDCQTCGKKFRLWSTLKKHSIRCPATKGPSSRSTTHITLATGTANIVLPAAASSGENSSSADLMLNENPANLVVTSGMGYGAAADSSLPTALTIGDEDSKDNAGQPQIIYVQDDNVQANQKS